MQIGCVQLQDFRNYRTLSYRPEARVNLVIGRNGQGKTNLLEAIAVLLTGRSFRTSRLAELPGWGAEAAVLSGDLQRSEGTRSVRRTLQRLVNGNWQASGESCSWARVIVFGWQDLAILHGAPVARRMFIDGFAARLYAGHLSALLRYRRLIGQRNRLLQSRATSERLAPWDEQLASVGMELIDRRRRAVAAVQTELARVYPAVSGEPTKVQVGYRCIVGESSQGLRKVEVHQLSPLIFSQ